MSMSRWAAPCALVLLVVPAVAWGAEPCIGPFDGPAVVRCALARSLDVRASRQELDVIAGMRLGAGLWLPSNPTVTFTAARRTSPERPGAAFFNWYVTLSQEIEIAGQRWARLDAVDAEAAAQVRRVAVAEQSAVAEVLTSYYEVLAAREIVSLSGEMSQVADALGAYAEGRAKEALMALVDADLVRAEAVRVGAMRFNAERQRMEAEAHLATMLGSEPATPIEVAGALEAPSAPSESLTVLTQRALTVRGEIVAAQMEKTALGYEMSALRRGRAPNPTLQAFVQNDGLNELVFGAGLSLPIPLPAPVGRTHRGPIAETRARMALAETSVEQIRRRVRFEVSQAWSDLRARVGAAQLYTPELVGRARADLAALREGLATRQLSVREALAAQRTLIELLIGAVDSRLQARLAGVELSRVTATPFAGVTR